MAEEVSEHSDSNPIISIPFSSDNDKLPEETSTQSMMSE